MFYVTGQPAATGNQPSSGQPAAAGDTSGNQPSSGDAGTSYIQVTSEERQAIERVRKKLLFTYFRASVLVFEVVLSWRVNVVFCHYLTC